MAPDHTRGHQRGAEGGAPPKEANAEGHERNPKVREGFLVQKGICKMGR